MTRFRWTVCALLFCITTINYVDRQVFGILAPQLQRDIGWSEQQYGNIVTAFQIAYGAGLLLVGRLIDRLGTRYGYMVAAAVWSVAVMTFALARSVTGFGLANFALGLGESGNFPAAIKTVADWFPRKERALATGIFNSGANIGALVAPLMVPLVTRMWGWRATFVVVGALGLLWVIVWALLFRDPSGHPRVSPAELAHIKSDAEDSGAGFPFARIVRLRASWAFAVGKFLTDPVWWFYIFWLPKFLDHRFGVGLAHIALPLAIIYIAADAGSILGGYLSSHLIKRGWTVNRARKVTMLICALCVVPITLVSFINNLWIVVALIGLAAAAHQGWSCNIFTFTSDVFPRRAVGSVVGFGGASGALGGALAAHFVGRNLQVTGSYFLIFLMPAAMYLGALLIIHLLVPKFEEIRI
jgi:ACS family hexuronate transporter-like MFS transporter